MFTHIILRAYRKIVSECLTKFFTENHVESLVLLDGDDVENPLDYSFEVHLKAHV